MKNLKHLLFVALFFCAAAVIGQTRISGTVVDETNEGLPGASVVIKGTTNGTQTDFDGKFTLSSQSNSGTIVISFIGYKSKEVSFSGAGDLGTIKLEEQDNVLDEIVIKGLIDVAKDRETPVAVSTIKAAEIQDKLGSQEFPEILNNTPSVYATKSGGGFGDARINIRGFAQENIAVLINGVPVNDMENGRVFWSNWAGLSDVTTAMQVQRGLGSSKLAISSVGGTINIITKTTDKKKGGVAMSSVGNDGYFKNLFSYSTGKNENGFAASFLLSRTAGEGYVQGTEFEGYNYFVGLGWDKEDHNIQFMLTGAPQTHNQRTTSFFNTATLENYIRYGRKYNFNHGYLNGKEFNWRKNFYHKPVASLNWTWQINDNSNLTTSAYVSFGRGGGTGDIGRLPGFRFASNSIFRNQDTGVVLWDDIVRYNQGEAVVFSDGNTYQRDPSDGNINDNRDNGLTRRASINSHNWVGLLSNYNTQLNENLSLDFGIDVRRYKGIHYRRLDNLLGANGYRVSRDQNNVGTVLTTEYDSDLGSLWNVFRSTDDEEKIDYHNDGLVRWFGVFGQLEYKNDNISAFVQASASQQGFKRIDYFNYLSTDPARETDWENILGGNIKGGLNWNIDENHNVFGNAGYYSKQPFFDAVFLNFRNDVNEDTVNEKILGLELGYGYRSENFSANVNLYRTQWKDRFVYFGFENSATNEEGNAQLQGITQLHTGAEIDFTYDVSENVRLLGTASIGNWRYKDRITGTAFDDFQNPIGTIDLDVDDVKVGNSPQTVFRIGAVVRPFENFSIDYNQRFSSKLYSDLVIDNSLNDDASQLDPAIELPGYSLSDLGFSYRWNLKNTDNQSINFRLNINNLFDQVYIAESITNYQVGRRGNFDTFDGINTDNKAFFGFGTTWNFTVRYRF
ncbi:TonB-dependent receptor [Pseudotenacibaculum haliotis]|uniref:TonB-dependent receptor n=1 Tax=Pseudotenacibaculum haliotis TaxID=1862138 RepID=A0ABW5LPN5_9FLAO